MMRKPVYKGERLDATSGEMRFCDDCAELATHRAFLRNRSALVGDQFYCDAHVGRAVLADTTRQIRTLPEYSAHLHRMKKWREQAFDSQMGLI